MKGMIACGASRAIACPRMAHTPHTPQPVANERAFMATGQTGSPAATTAGPSRRAASNALRFCIAFGGWNAVHWSVYNSHPIALELLLRKLSTESKKKLVNEADPDDLRTPLHIAAYRAQPSMVKALLKEGANTKAEDVRKNTPGLLAAKMGREANAELIDEADGKPKLGRRGSGYMQYAAPQPCQQPPRPARGRV